jgi:hypothetical protein
MEREMGHGFGFGPEERRKNLVDYNSIWGTVDEKQKREETA